MLPPTTVTGVRVPAQSIAGVIRSTPAPPAGIGRRCITAGDILDKTETVATANCSGGSVRRPRALREAEQQGEGIDVTSRQRQDVMA